MVLKYGSQFHYQIACYCKIPHKTYICASNFPSLWHLTGILAAPPSRRLSNFKEILWFKISISRLQDVTRQILRQDVFLNAEHPPPYIRVVHSSIRLWKVRKDGSYYCNTSAANNFLDLCTWAGFWGLTITLPKSPRYCTQRCIN